MNTRQTEASFARLSRDDENNGAANKTGYMPETIPGCIDIFFFFSSVERKRVKKKTVFRAHKEDFCHRLFNAVPCIRSPPFSRRVKAIPFVPRAP